MRNTVIGMIAGGVVGVVLGATVVAPRLEPPQAPPAAPAVEGEASAPESEAPAPVRPVDPGAVFTLRTASAFRRSLPRVGTQVGRLEKVLWRASGGTIRLRFDDDGKRVSQAALLDSVATGKIDAAFASPALWGKKSRGLALFGAMPFGPAIDEYLAWFYFGGGQKIYRSLLEKRNVHGILCGVLASEGGGWFRRPLHSVNDLHGLRMAVSGLPAKVLARLGVTTRALSAAEVAAALRKGAVDAAAFSMPAVDFDLGMDRLVKNYYLPGWHRPVTVFDLLVNRERWAALPDAVKARIETACGDNLRHALAKGEAAHFPALKQLQAAEVEIRRWSPEILEALSRAWSEVAAEEAASDPEFRQVWESLSSFRRDYGIWRELGHP